MKWSKKVKKLKIFGVAKKDAPENFLTIALKKEECVEYVKKYVLLEHLDHFLSWANLRNLDSHAIETQFAYLTDCIELDEWDKYIIVPLYYTYDEVVAIIRMFGNCTPLGCSFDKAMEKLYWLYSQDPEDLKKILDNINLFNQLDEQTKADIENILKESEQDNEYKSR